MLLSRRAETSRRTTYFVHTNLLMEQPRHPVIPYLRDLLARRKIQSIVQTLKAKENPTGDDHVEE